MNATRLPACWERSATAANRSASSIILTLRREFTHRRPHRSRRLRVVLKRSKHRILDAYPLFGEEDVHLRSLVDELTDLSYQLYVGSLLPDGQQDSSLVR